MRSLLQLTSKKNSNIIKYSLFLMMVLSGCSSDFFLGKDNTTPPTPLVKNSSDSRIKPIWSYSLGGGIGQHFYRFNITKLNNKLLMVNKKGFIVAVDDSSGTTVWKERIDGVRTGIANNEQMAFVTTEKGELVALDSKNGKILWHQTLGGNAITTPIVNQDAVILRTMNGVIIAFDANTGHLKWSYAIAQPEVTLSGGGSPAFYQNKAVLVPTDMGQLGLLSLEDGQVIWGSSFNKPKGYGTVKRLSDIDAKPIIENDIAYVNMFNKAIYAISMKNKGSTIWEQTLSSYHNMISNQGALYAVAENSQIVSLSKKTGGILWTLNDLKGRKLTQPVLIGNFMVIGDFEGYVHLVDIDTGELSGSRKISAKAFAFEVLADQNSAYFQDIAGRIYKISL